MTSLKILCAFNSDTIENFELLSNMHRRAKKVYIFSDECLTWHPFGRLLAL